MNGGALFFGCATAIFIYLFKQFGLEKTCGIMCFLCVLALFFHYRYKRMPIQDNEQKEIIEYNGKKYIEYK